jgi:hypothetical protein
MTHLFDGKLAVRISLGPFSLENVAFFVDELTISLPLVVLPKTFVIATPVKESSSIAVHFSLFELPFMEVEAIV